MLYFFSMCNTDNDGLIDRSICTTVNNRFRYYISLRLRSQRHTEYINHKHISAFAYHTSKLNRDIQLQVQKFNSRESNTKRLCRNNIDVMFIHVHQGFY